MEIHYFHPSINSLLLSVYVLSHFSHVWLIATPWTVPHQAPLSMGFSRQENRSGSPCPLPGDLPDPGIKPASLMSPALACRLFTTCATWEGPVISGIRSNYWVRCRLRTEVQVIEKGLLGEKSKSNKMNFFSLTESSRHATMFHPRRKVRIDGLAPSASAAGSRGKAVLTRTERKHCLFSIYVGVPYPGIFRLLDVYITLFLGEYVCS